MSARVPVVGLAFRVCVWFALHPDARLTEKELGGKFNATSVRGSLRDGVRCGLLEKYRDRRAEDGREVVYYAAGPRLKSMLEVA